MENKTSRIPDEVLKEIFPKKLNRYEASEKVYSHLKKMILSGKLKKGQKLTHEGILNLKIWLTGLRITPTTLQPGQVKLTEDLRLK